MTPSLGGNIDSSFFSVYDQTVQAGLNTGAYVILDLVRQLSGDTKSYTHQGSSIAMLAGMAQSSTRVVQRPLSMPAFGLSWRKNMRVTTRSSCVF